MYSCWVCQGTGVEYWIDPAHSGSCNGDNCGDECPTGVQYEEPCCHCSGKGLITYDDLKRQLVHEIKDNLVMIDILEIVEFCEKAK